MPLGFNIDDSHSKTSFSFGFTSNNNQQPQVNDDQNEYQKKYGNMDVWSAAAGGGYVQ